MYTTKQKSIALLVGIAVILLVISPVFLSAEEANHHCTGHDCPVCAWIHAAEWAIRSIGAAATGGDIAVCFAALLLAAAGVVLRSPDLHITLISLRVRLNN